jgi:hypothetical protein
MFVYLGKWFKSTLSPSVQPQETNSSEFPGNSIIFTGLVFLFYIFKPEKEDGQEENK